MVAPSSGGPYSINGQYETILEQQQRLEKISQSMGVRRLAGAAGDKGQQKATDMRKYFDLNTGQSYSVSFSQYVSERMSENQHLRDHRNAAILKSLPKISTTDSAQELAGLQYRSNSISTQKVP